MTGSFTARDSLAATYDGLSTHRNRVRLGQWVVKLGGAGFLIHLGLVFLASSLPHAPAWIAAVGKNYLAAIYTPFTFILFYEVLVLIAAIPHSMAQSVANQFEIVSLIFVRGFFKDIAAIDHVDKIRPTAAEMVPAVTDLCAGLFMFFLVALFHHVSRARDHAEAAEGRPADLRIFVARKKAIALALTVLLLVLTLYTLAEFIRDSWHVIYVGPIAETELQTMFYTDVFSVMIFTDVLILVLSLVVSDRYELVFRNAAFVISTILIRLSLTTERPWGAALALLSMMFAILTMLIYNYNAGVQGHHKASVRKAVS